MAGEGSPVRVIVVEDHPALAFALRELLGADDRLILVDVVGTGSALLGHPHLDAVDVVLTDVHLPDFDGRTVADALRPEHPDIRVVVMSGSGDERTAAQALARGAAAFLDKGSLGSEIGDRIVEAAQAEDSQVRRWQ